MDNILNTYIFSRMEEIYRMNRNLCGVCLQNEKKEMEKVMRRG